jgi:hypothetical protein
MKTRNKCLCWGSETAPTDEEHGQAAGEYRERERERLRVREWERTLPHPAHAPRRRAWSQTPSKDICVLFMHSQRTMMYVGSDEAERLMQSYKTLESLHSL